MRHTLRRRRHRLPAFTLLELTVVISVLISLASLLVTGARAWKRGSDRAGCLLTMRHVQVALRSYQNMNLYNFGQTAPPENGTSDIVEHLMSKGYLNDRQYQQALGNITCTGGGHYTREAPDQFPALGTPYLACSLSPEPENHEPLNHEQW